MQNKKLLTKKLETELAYFFESTPPPRLSRNLRRLLTSYLVLQDDGHLMDIEDLLVDMQNLFELLDVASDELTSIA